jgi:hypothetical protein
MFDFVEMKFEKQSMEFSYQEYLYQVPVVRSNPFATDWVDI